MYRERINDTVAKGILIGLDAAARLVATYPVLHGDHLAGYSAPSVDAPVLAEMVRELGRRHCARYGLNYEQVIKEADEQS